MNDAMIAVKHPWDLSEKAMRYLERGASWRSISQCNHVNKPVPNRQTTQTTMTIVIAFSVVFQVKYLRSSSIAKSAFPSRTSVETMLRRMKRWHRKSDIIAKVFPVNHLTPTTSQSMYIGTFMSALKKSINARLPIRMFGKVRSFLNRTMIPRTSPLPGTAMIATNERSTVTKIAKDEKYSISMTSVPRPASFSVPRQVTFS